MIEIICRLDNQIDNVKFCELKRVFHKHLLLAPAELFISANRRYI